jgi:hypothetical protein
VRTQANALVYYTYLREYLTADCYPGAQDFFASKMTNYTENARFTAMTVDFKVTLIFGPSGQNSTDRGC